MCCFCCCVACHPVLLSWWKTCSIMHQIQDIEMNRNNNYVSANILLNFFSLPFFFFSKYVILQSLIVWILFFAKQAWEDVNNTEVTFSWLSAHRIQRRTFTENLMTLWMTMPAKHISLSSQKLYAHFDTQHDKTVCLHSQLNSQYRNEY